MLFIGILNMVAVISANSEQRRRDDFRRRRLEFFQWLLREPPESESVPSRGDLKICTELKRNEYGMPQRSKLPVVIRAQWFNHRQYYIFLHTVEVLILRGYIMQARNEGTVVGQFYRRGRLLLDCEPGFRNTIYHYTKYRKRFDYVWWTPYAKYYEKPVSLNYSDLYMMYTIILEHNYYWQTRLKIPPPPEQITTTRRNKKGRKNTTKKIKKIQTTTQSLYVDIIKSVY